MKLELRIVRIVLGCLNDCGAEIPSGLAYGRVICSEKCMNELNNAYHEAYPKEKRAAYNLDDIWLTLPTKEE